jgi:hypothetical protein
MEVVFTCLIVGFLFRCHCCAQAQATIVANFNEECIDFVEVFLCAWLQIAIISSSMSTSCWYVCGWPFMHPLCMFWKLSWPLFSSCPTCLILFQYITFYSSIYNILFSSFTRWLCLQLLCVCNLLFRLCFLLHYCLTCFILLQFITFYSSIYNIMFSNFNYVYNSKFVSFFCFFICLIVPLGPTRFYVLGDE